MSQTKHWAKSQSRTPAGNWVRRRMLLALALHGAALGQVQQAQALQTADESTLSATTVLAQAAPASTAAQGYDFLDKGWVDDAIAAFETVLKREPEALEARLGLAIAYQRAGRDGSAWRAYSAVLEQDSRNETALRAVGTMGSYRPDWQARGIAALDQLLSIYPGEVEPRAQRAVLLGYQQRFGEAIADYEQLLALGRDGTGSNGPAPISALPSDQQLSLLMNAAQIYTYSQQTDLALPLFERYLSRGGLLNRPASLAYATALGQQNRAGDAIALLESLPSATGDEAFEQRLALALAYQANAEPDASLAALQPLLNPLPQDLEQRRAIANALVPIDLPPPALLPQVQSLLQDPDPVEFLQFRAAQMQLAQGDLLGAQASLLAYQSATPETDLGTEFLLADIDQRSGNLEASAQRYDNLMDLTEGQPRLDALGGVAAIRFEQQRLGEAEGLYRKLLSQRPEDYQARRTFAELMLARDKPKAALSQFALAESALTQASVSPAEETSPSLEQRQRQVRRSFLRRRGFQPRWERY